MAVLPNNILLWGLLLAPGFIAVLTATTLAATERNLPTYYLIFSSLVSSLFVDLLFLWGFKLSGGDIGQLFAEGSQFLFTPEFRFDLILGLVSLSFSLGIVYAIGMIYSVPAKLRTRLWAQRKVTGHKGQPWQSFLQNAGQVRVKTGDDELYKGVPVRWNNDFRETELVIRQPHRYNPSEHEYEPAGGKYMLFTSGDIQRVLHQKDRDEFDRTTSRFSGLGGSTLLAVFGVAAFLATIHFLLPTGLQEALAFDHQRFAVYTLLTSAYVHASNAHLYGNLAGYLIATIYTYLLCLAVDERRWFRRTFVVFLVALPILVNLSSYAIFATQYPSASPVSRGFSGVVAGFGGFLLVALGVFITKRRSGQLGWAVAVSAFLLLMGIVHYIYATVLEPLVWGLVASGMVLLGGSYAWEVDIDFDGLDARSFALDLGTVALVFVVLTYIIVAMFPSEVIQNGSLTNIFAHAMGFLIGILISTMVREFSGPESMINELLTFLSQ